MIVVAQDPYARQGMAALFEAAEGFEVLDPDSDAMAGHGADLVVLDLTGADTDTETPGAPRLLALVDDEDTLAAARDAGAQGIVARSAPPAQLEAAARAVMAGLEVVDPTLDFGAGASMGPGAATTPWGQSLTAREQEVLALLAEGASNREIARQLDVSPNTAKFHVNAILSKLGAKSRTEAVVLAARMGLVHL